MNERDCTISVSEKNNKKISFNPHVKIQNMYVWTFAYQAARKSDWMRIAADRYRFELRKKSLETKLAKIGFFFLNKKN